MRLDELPGKLNAAKWIDERTRAMQRIVLIAEGNAKRNAPVKTGNLRRSITSSVEDAGTRGIVGSNVVYARIVHEGASARGSRGRGRAAQPFIRQGIEDSRDEIERELKAAAERYFDSVGR